MPQFEIFSNASDAPSIIRARNVRTAVVSFFSLADSDQIEITDAGTLDGWESVAVNGTLKGKVRLFHRMKFRRD